MKSRIILIVTIVFILITWDSSALVAGKMPAEMASHWNINGQADDYSSQSFGLWFLPIMTLALIGVLYFIPRLDPLKKNLVSFESTYHLFIAGFAGFMGYVHLLTLAWNLGWKFNMNQWILPGFAVLFFLAGHLIKNARQNYFIGIRTPWTLANPIVWEKTHRVGGVGFQIAAILSLIGVFFPNQAMYFILVPVLFIAFGSMVYSYILFQKYQPKN